MATAYTSTSFDASAYDLYVESLRSREYESLRTTTYLDHAGTTLYARSLMDTLHHDLTQNLFGNPHSISPASNLSTLRVEEARGAVLDYFNADHALFDVVFTSSATAAIKLLADCFRDQDFHYYYHKDSHSSIVGVRELARTSKCLVSNDDVEAFISQADNDTQLKLFAYPAQSNMTGYRPPLSWSGRVRKQCKDAYVLLDAASYLTSARLDLSNSESCPDFIALSFYKIFGFPTGLGALIVRRASFEVLKHRRYFGGGTVDQVTVIGEQTHAIKETTIHDRLEDGTLAFHLIASLKHAIDVQKRLFKSANFISSHTTTTARWLFDSMRSLRHKNGCQDAEIYKEPQATYRDPNTQGPILAFSILKSDGNYIGKSQFERLANDCGFQIRTGGVCNPGGIASMLRLQHWELRRNFAEGVRCGDDVDIMGSKPTGVIRVSLGPMSTMSDVRQFVSFLEEFFVDRTTTTVPIAHQSGGLIAPVTGCAGFHVDSENYAAFRTWNDQWCLVLGDSNELIEVESSDIEVQVDVQDGTLVFDNQFKMSLWNLPCVSDIQTLTANEARKWDVYNGPINTWLTARMGKSCLLARYRAVDIKDRPQSLTCVVASCYAQQASTEDLRQHYRTHAQSFLNRHSFATQNKPSVHTVPIDTAPAPSNPTRIHSAARQVSTDIAKTGTKNICTFIAHIRVTPSHHSLRTDSFEDADDLKSLTTAKKKQKRDVIRRLFSRSKN